MKSFIAFSAFIFFSLAALTSCDDKKSTTSAPDNSLLESIAENSFASNAANARFIPVLDSAEDIRLGARFDTLTGQIVGSSPCISDFSTSENGNQNYNMRLVEVTDNYSQMNALDIDVSVQGSYLGASANAKATFVNSQKFTQQSQKFLVYAKAERKPKIITPNKDTLFKLTGDAKAVLHDRQAFRDLCGDAFVVAIFEGIEMFGMLNYVNSSQASRKEISTKMGVSYGAWEASGSITSTVNKASESGKLTISAQLGGRCDKIDLGGDSKSRWANMINAAGKLQDCADTGGNINSYKIISYSSAFIRDWPYEDDKDPNIRQIIYYYTAYGAVLDSINSLLTNRENAYQIALLHRGVDLPGLDKLAAEIRLHRTKLKSLLTTCQSSSNPANRENRCLDESSLQSELAEFPHPYIYRAQLPLYFVEGKPVEAFLSNSDITDAIVSNNVQSPRDIACAFADKAGLNNYSGCPNSFDSILADAKDAVRVADFPWPLDHPYMFQTMSTSKNLCMVAPQPKVIVKATNCNFTKPATARQRMEWLKTGQLRYRNSDKDGVLCVEGRNSANCDSVRHNQLWRFVPDVANKEIGLLQNADGLCLIHSNVDKNVRYSNCYGNENKKFYQWKPIAVK